MLRIRDLMCLSTSKAQVMMNSELDNVTRSLFAQLRKRAYGGIDDDHENGNYNKDFDVLICPKCSDRLEPLIMPLAVDPIDGRQYQTIWWTCRGLNTKTCIFPLNMPADVYWTRRTVEQAREGLIPLPNIHLLSAIYHYLYPNYFNSGRCDEKTQNRLNTKFMSAASTISIGRSSCQFMDKEHNNNYFLTTPYTTKYAEENLSIQNGSIRYGNADSRRNVELFSDTDTALNSVISLRFCPETFLSNINSEMSRQHLVRPTPAINSQQRRRLAYLMQRYRTANGGVAPSPAVVDVLRQRAKADVRSARSRAASPTNSLRSLLTMVDVKMPTEKPQEQPFVTSSRALPEAFAADLWPAPPEESTILESQVEEERPPTDPTTSAIREVEMISSHIDGFPTISNNANNHVAATTIASTTDAPTTKETNSRSSAKTSKRVETQRQIAINSSSIDSQLAPACTFDDPEIQSVMKRNFDELMRMFNKRKRRKTKKRSKPISTSETVDNDLFAALRSYDLLY